MKYVAYEKLAGSANIVVDGRPNPSTVLTLSHWPGNPTPEQLKADLSAEIVFNYIENPALQVEAEAGTNNHFDVDGLISLFTLLYPERARERRQFLIDVASAGDFGVCHDRDAMRVCFALRAWDDVQLSPLKASYFQLPYLEKTSVLYEELLERLPNIVERIDRLEQFWSKEDRLFQASEEGLAKGSIRIEERKEIDLAVVFLSEERAERPWSEMVHENAIHNRTDCMRVLLTADHCHELYYRYETWVEYRSRSLAPRIDLSELATSLSRQESRAGVWTYDGNDDIVPRLKLMGASESDIGSEDFLERLSGELSGRT